MGYLDDADYLGDNAPMVLPEQLQQQIAATDPDEMITLPGGIVMKKTTALLIAAALIVWWLWYKNKRHGSTTQP